jgi:hypothetical protein
LHKDIEGVQKLKAKAKSCISINARIYVRVQIANVHRCSATCFVRRRDLEEVATQTVNPIQRCQKYTKDAVADKEAAIQHVCDAE